MKSKSSKISLYIHVPFCTTKCKYCDFYSETTGFKRIGSVVDEIINQLEYNYIKLDKPQIDTIFIGGGTPSILPAKELTKLLHFVKSISPHPKEWSIESNPESISKYFLETCLKFGVNRLSVGVQSFNDDILTTLGRSAKESDVKRGFSLIKEYWTQKVNLDLISSTPGQTTNTVCTDISKALELNPDHISFYALSLEEGTVLEDEVSKGLVKELPSTIQEDIWFKGKELLHNAGFKNYEVSNYTKDSPCLHNVNYWELKPYLGVGPGAVSTVLDSNGQVIRVSTAASIEKFIKGNSNNWGEVKEEISPLEFLKDYIMMGLRLKKGINRERFSAVFGRPVEQIVTITSDLVLKGHLNLTDSHFALSSSGYDIMNRITIEILDSIEGTRLDSINWFY